MTTRIAVYARYSSDLQKPTSLEDQVRLCRRYIENGALGRGSPVIEVYTDAALSGWNIGRASSAWPETS